jgi:hypothetical protein
MFIQNISDSNDTIQEIKYWKRRGMERQKSTCPEGLSLSRVEDNLWTYVRFEVFKAVTMRNAVFCDVAPCGSCKNRRSSETSVLTRATPSNVPGNDILYGRTFAWLEYLLWSFWAGVKRTLKLNIGWWCTFVRRGHYCQLLFQATLR